MKRGRFVAGTKIQVQRLFDDGCTALHTCGIAAGVNPPQMDDCNR